ncbi:Serine/threonine protein kinase [Candidatus Sulfopaludibacter sp. SbA6]|nr:Serine/threonine protein kinase [Candidatus Sulfopaludibacter sp. SbA6]
MKAGDHLGPYEILAPLGAGGMGEVYRARDSKLKREVALKVLPDVFASDPERMARFQREAEVLAALNHPNIAAIYGLEGNALVMELVEGEDLTGPLPVETALTCARQIADALEYAHEKGIVHRDLKPANVKVTPEGVVKVLDFGLAKAIEDPGPASDPASSPTLTLGATRMGVIMGTAAYMSPEQASGKTTDRRADIWSFGAVLYEMLAGKRAFAGESVSDTLATVLKLDPDWDALPAATPASIGKLVRRCLTKDRKQRLQAIGEARIALENPERDEPVPASAPLQSRLGMVTTLAVAVLTVALAALAFIHFREQAPAAEMVRFQIPAPEKSTFYSGPYASPDGRRIAFAATGQDGRTVVWIHSLDSLGSRPLAGTEGVSNPILFWSPDSRFIAFAVPGKLKKVEASGGPPQTLCDLSGGLRGGAWSRGGVIVFGVFSKGLMRVSEAGGAASPLTTLDASGQETSHGRPSFLPDGRHFVYLRDSTAPEKMGIYLGSLDAKPEQQGSKRLVATGSSATYAAYAPSPDPALGYILFVREGSLMAQAFDARRLEMAGEAVPIAEGLPDGGPPLFSVSTTGVLAYRTGGAGFLPTTQLTWFDRAGKNLGTVGEPGQYNTVALSPDGTRVAVSRNDPQAAGTSGLGNTDIWLHEFSRGTSTRFTFDPFFDFMAVWSPDGSRIIFASNRDGPYNLYQKVSSGAGNEEALLKSNESKFPYDWSSDGRFLLYAAGAAGKPGLWVLPLTGDDHKPVPYLQTESAGQARFSPDSRWIAYMSSVSGKREVYVRPFPTASGGKWMVSKGGGSEPRWRPDGKELFYISADSKLMSVEVATASGAFQPGIPKALFAAPIWGGATTNNVTRYDVTADGNKFLINSLPTETTAAPPSPITVVLNWEAGLKK